MQWGLSKSNDFVTLICLLAAGVYVNLVFTGVKQMVLSPFMLVYRYIMRPVYDFMHYIKF